MATIHRQHDGAVGPGSRYSQTIETATGVRWLHLSGQIGVAACCISASNAAASAFAKS